MLLRINLSPRQVARIGRLLDQGQDAGQWQGFLARYCFWWGVRQSVPDHDTWHRLTQWPVILMYHAFCGPEEPPSRYILPARQFHRQLAWLKWTGYKVIGLTDLLRYRQQNRLPPARSVVISIDDGYADVRSLAYPLLRRHGFSATVFLVSSLVGTINRWDDKGAQVGRPLLSWSDIHEMHSGGIEYGAHSKSHASLTTLQPDQIENEVKGSQTELEARLGTSIQTFAYPYGRHNALSRAAVASSGFQGACTCEEGVNDPAVHPHLLRRIEVRGTDSLFTFALALWSGHRPPTDRPRKNSPRGTT